MTQHEPITERGGDELLPSNGAGGSSTDVIDQMGPQDGQGPKRDISELGMKSHCHFGPITIGQKHLQDNL